MSFEEWCPGAGEAVRFMRSTASRTEERRKSVIFGWVMSDRYASGITQHEERRARMAWLDDATRM